MIVIRDKIVDMLKAEFPTIDVRPFIGRFDSTQEGQLSYPSPAIIVAILPLIEAPVEFDPWPLQLNFGIAITSKAASAKEADRLGWIMTLQVAKMIYRNCWGFQKGMEITPAVIDGIQKNEQVNPQGTPTGMYYWTINFHNLGMFEVVLAP